MNISKGLENLEFFNFEQDLELVIASRHWIEWIWDVFWLLLIEVIGNACLFATLSYERFGMAHHAEARCYPKKKVNRF